MENEHTFVLSGAAKNPYTFTVYPWNTPLVSFGGVYLVLRRDEQRYSIIYIGCSGELGSDLLYHPLIVAFDKAKTTHVAVHIESVMAARYRKQLDLVAHFLPLLNN